MTHTFWDLLERDGLIRVDVVQSPLPSPKFLGINLIYGAIKENYAKYTSLVFWIYFQQVNFLCLSYKMISKNSH